MFTGRRSGGSSVMSRSRSRIRPAVGSSKPPIIRRVVVLPQPDGPSSEKNSPACTSNETPSTARTTPKRFSRSMRRISAGAPLWTVIGTRAYVRPMSPGGTRPGGRNGGAIIGAPHGNRRRASTASGRPVPSCGTIWRAMPWVGITDHLGLRRCRLLPPRGTTHALRAGSGTPLARLGLPLLLVADLRGTLVAGRPSARLDPGERRIPAAIE